MRFFDGHCDTILHCYQTGEHLANCTGHWSLDKVKGFTGAAQFFACFGEPEDMPGRPLWEVFQEEISLIRREVEANRDRIALCTTADELEAAWKAGKVAGFLSAEGAELLDCDLEKLEMAYNWGVRAVNITWNHENALSGTNMEATDRGLSEQGRAFVRRMQELGMLVDVSHLSDPGFWDVIELADKPIFASHSNSRAVCFHSRNLTDGQFTAIIKNHGVAGLNMCDVFLGPHPTVDTLVAHIEHWFSLGGEENVSLGGDWDGISRPPAGIEGIQDIDKLADRLLQMNYPEERVKGLFYNNLIRVVREVCTM